LGRVQGLKVKGAFLSSFSDPSKSKRINEKDSTKAESGFSGFLY